MNQDEAEYLRRRISVKSDRALDNIADLRNLDTSQSTIYSPTRERMFSNSYRGDRDGDVDPPHHYPPENELVEVTGPSNSRHIDKGDQAAGETTPVKRLRMKSDLIGSQREGSKPGPVERQLTDTYIESLSRTPRYNSQTDYNKMVDQLAENDPFCGEYTPSGKSKKAQHRKKKHKHNREDSDIPMDDTDGSPPKKSEGKFSGKKRKSKKGSGSRDSTGTFTVEGHSNPSFERSVDVSVDKHEAESVQSNGTYTLKREDSLASLKGFHPPVTRNDTTNSFTIKRSSSKRKTKVGIDRIGFTNFVKENILQREPKIQENATTSSGKNAGKDFSNMDKGKHVWHYHTHTIRKPCDSYGEIEFHGYGHDTESSPYIRLANDTQPELVLDIILNYWKLPTPKLLISVTGGAKRFDMKPKLLEKFKRGLINAATSTGAWIITGGTHTGVMEIVGEGVQEYVLTYGKQKDIVCLGVPLWGVIANKDALDEDENGNFPAIYSKEGLDAEKGKKTIPLDHNHTHFVIVDDGSRDKFGGEIEFRANLEKTISHMSCDSEGMSSNLQVNTPVISLIVEGGVGTMKTVSESIKNGIPVLVLEGTGRAADFIAAGYLFTKDIMNEDRSHFPPHYQQTMEEIATNNFEWKPGETNKPAKISLCLKQLESCLKSRRMITVFNLGDAENKDLDKAILNALLKATVDSEDANKSNQSAQLSLALAWNRSDVARNTIFSSSKKTIFGASLHDAMTTALIQNKKTFVKLFLENGVELKDFLTVKNLWNLYANCLNDKTDRSAQLFNNLIMYLKVGRGDKSKQTWGAYLCCRPVEHLGNQPELVELVGKTIVHIVGDEAINPYDGSKTDRFKVCDVDPCMGYIVDDKATEKSMAGKKWRHVKHDFELPERELFLWALLLNRMDLAKLFWKLGKDHLGTALLAAALLKGLAKVADGEEEIELSVSLEESALMFEKLAVDVLSHCYKHNKALAHQLLVRQLVDYGNTTLLLLADAHELMDFMDHTSCQTKLNSVWKGRMALYTSTYKILAAMVIPFLIPAIKFTSNKNPTEYLDDDDALDYDNLGEAMAGEGTAIISNSRVAPETESRSKQIKRKLYQVSLAGTGKDGISLVSAIYHFYTAPVTKFYWYTVAYLAFLAIFSYFVLTNLHPTSSVNSPSNIEYVTWGWTITMVIEEVRQVLTRDQRSLVHKLRSWYSSVWNRFDLIMYLLFMLSVILRFVLSEDNFTWARMTYSITLAMYFLRFMQAFFVEKNIGPKVIMIRKMLTDLMFFFAILAVFVLSFGIAYQANLFPNDPPSWKLLRQVVYLPYWQMYGELFLENMEGEEPSSCTTNETLWRSGAQARCAENNAIVPLLLAVYMLLTNILLVNLLIAMFSDTFQKVQDNSLKVWRFYKFSLVYEYYERPSVFPPFIILNHAFRGVRWLMHKSFRKLNYHDDFKLHLSARDNTRLTLFEREAVEDYLHTTRELKREQLDSKVTNTSERLEKVIDELDNIKDSVTKASDHKNSLMQTVTDVTPRDVSSSLLTSRSAKTTVPQDPRLQDQMDQLSTYVREELTSIHNSMHNIQAMLRENQRQAVTSPSLDITHVAASQDV
ncbi:transient receptor potential cation channel subfamily M member 1-like [Mizuhopecten yessoensis]|uniref:transient receptor potential cation channel subfamily M member 1-like n=1 Tax=Mizuhopecten yessoensis TaxID=6573 RepID=UPI000B45731C|nr:transient receptor potential cation channel subfamily M member 1-like [Mizuhopecten yessoensis]